MDDNDMEEEFEESPNHYAILNIDKEASEEEIKNAFRAMSVRYHPDKHVNSNHKDTAEKIFDQVRKAYETLSNPQTRMIYDIYGQKGLDAGWHMIERQRTPAEIKEEYERLQREKEERRMEQITNPTGSLKLEVNATNFFSNDGYEEYGSGSMLPEMLGMSMHQSIQAPVTKKDTATLHWVVQHLKKENSAGLLTCSWRHLFDNQTWSEVDIGGGSDGAAVLSFKGIRNMNKTKRVEVTLTPSIRQARLNAGLRSMVRSQLTKNTALYFSLNHRDALINVLDAFSSRSSFGQLFRPNSVSTMFTIDTDRYNLFTNLQLGLRQSFAKLSYVHQVTDDTKLKGGLMYSPTGDGLVLEYGCVHQVSPKSTIGGTISVGLFTGVNLHLKVSYRHNQTFDLPIFLSDEFSSSALFYGTVVPVAVYFAVKNIILLPMMLERKKKDMEESREKHAAVIAEKKREAESAINLMLQSYEQIVEFEQGRSGLVILEAWYGKFISKNRRTDRSTPYVINVVIPIQCLVRDSKLMLGDQPKWELTGIYDPCINEEKVLKIVYEFRGIVHEGIFKDTENVRCPKQSHRISTKVS